jgi:deoxyribonuclease-4
MTNKHFYYGAHIEVNLDNIIESIINVEKMGGNIVQIFLTKPLHKGVTNISDKQLNNVKKMLVKKNMKMVIHSSYMLNFARIPLGISKFTISLSRNSFFNTLSRNTKSNVKISWWIKNLIDELNYASKMGAIGCVIHLGKHLELTKKMAIENMLESLIYVIENTPSNILLIIETSSGQGTELCYKLNKFKYFYEMFPIKYRKRIGICIDSCHVFAAGYDLRTRENVINFFDVFSKMIDLKKVVLFHLNDSKKELGSRVDRHEILGKGHIGTEGLIQIIKICYKLNIPIILETPRIDFTSELKLIKKVINNII